MHYGVDPVPTIPAASLVIFLVQVGVLLALAFALGHLAMRLRMPSVVGELLAGVLLGPSLLGLLAPGLFGWLFPHQLEQFALLDAVAQVGMLLLVGMTGMQMDLGLARRRGLTAARVSIAGLVVPVGLGIGIGYALAGVLSGPSTEPSVFALFIGIALGVSSIPMIAKTLSDMGLLHRDVGQLTLIAGMIDDALGWLMLSVVASAATRGLRASSIVVSLGLLLAVLTLALLTAPVVRSIMVVTTRSRDAKPVLAVTVTMAMLAAAGTQALGLEAVLGAFLCGIIIRASGVDLVRLKPLHAVVMSVLAPTFFATAGLRMDLSRLAHPHILLAAAAVLAAAVLGKFVGAFIGALSSRLSAWEALALGAGMNARGVIQMVVAMVGLRLGLLNTEAYTIIVLVAIVTSLMAPPILRTAMSHVNHTAEERQRKRLLAFGERTDAGEP